MQPSWVVPVVLLIIVAIVCMLVLQRRRRSPVSSIAKVPDLGASSQSATDVSQGAPNQVAIVDATARPLVTIQAMGSSGAFDAAQPVDCENGLISRLSALLQAVPSVIVAASASGKQLMEVVVNGTLVRAADGNGLRAIAMGPNGITEHARLFEVKNLENMINAAAIWQIASVVVAQKHLADISRKLDDIKVGVQNLAKFLDQQRRSRIEATYEYLSQAYLAIKGGELPHAVRIELESCERDLAEIQRHLVREYQDLVGRKVEHKETFGTGELVADIDGKIEKLGRLGQDIELALKTRIAAWYVLSLYPGEAQLKSARRTKIEDSIADVQALVPQLSISLSKEIAGVDSIWNRGATLATRRDSLATKLSSASEALTTTGQLSESGVETSGELLLTHDRPTRMWLEFQNGVVVGARTESR